MDKKDQRRVEGKVIIVTGANSGIGRATAILLNQHGARLGLLDQISPVEVVQIIASRGGEAMAIECDVRLPEQVERAIESICEKYGALDGETTPFSYELKAGILKASMLNAGAQEPRTWLDS